MNANWAREETSAKVDDWLWSLKICSKGRIDEEDSIDPAPIPVRVFLLMSSFYFWSFQLGRKLSFAHHLRDC